MAWGEWIAYFIPHHREFMKGLEKALDARDGYRANLIESNTRIEQLERNLQESAAARIQAEDTSRFLQTRVADLQQELAATNQRLYSVYEKSSDFIALAASGGRRAVFSDTPATDSDRSESDPMPQPITTGRMRAVDARAMATKLAEVEDLRKATEARNLAQRLRQQAAAESVDGTIQAQSDPRSPEQRKAAEDIANAIEREILGQTG